MVDLVERLNALLKQDRNCYRAKDYLSSGFQQKLQSSTRQKLKPLSGKRSFSDASTTTTTTTTTTTNINETWREKICEWSYQVADHFDFSREVVSISISFLDRYLSARLVDKKEFQLVAMTSLYLAIKLYEPTALSMQSMIELSRGYFTVDQMATMEMAILKVLSWHVHPATSVCLARHFLQLLPSHLDVSIKHDIIELTRFLTELAVIDYFFVPKSTSFLSLSALLHAMQNLHLDNYIPDFLEQLKLLDNFNPYSNEVEECGVRLKQLYYLQGGYACGQIPQEEESEENDTRDETVSPICVSAFDKSTATTASIRRDINYISYNK